MMSEHESIENRTIEELIDHMVDGCPNPAELLSHRAARLHPGKLAPVRSPSWRRSAGGTRSGT